MSQDLAQLLTKSHRDLRRWFLFHQECLLLGQDHLAEQCFVAFADYLKAHLQFEDNNLFPLLEKQGLNSRWPLLVYSKEHEKIIALLNKNRDLLADYTKMQGREKRLALLTLLDNQRSFNNVMEHHEEREEMDLFLLLNGFDTAALSLQWQQIEQALEQQYKNIDQRIDAYLRDTV